MILDTSATSQQYRDAAAKYVTLAGTYDDLATELAGYNASVVQATAAVQADLKAIAGDVSATSKKVLQTYDQATQQTRAAFSKAAGKAAETGRSDDLVSYVKAGDKLKSATRRP